MAILDKDNSVLLIIDLQEKLIKAQFNKEEIEKKTTILAEAANILEISTVVSEQYPKGLGYTVKFVKEKLPAGTVFVEKTSFSCCGEENFRNTIKGLNKKQVIVCGMETQVCVHQTVSDLIAMGFEAHIVQDAVGSRKEWEYDQGLKRMLNSGAIPSTTETVVFELLKDAKNPNFKAVQALIK